MERQFHKSYEETDIRFSGGLVDAMVVREIGKDTARYVQRIFDRGIWNGRSREFIDEMENAFRRGIVHHLLLQNEGVRGIPSFVEVFYEGERTRAVIELILGSTLSQSLYIEGKFPPARVKSIGLKILDILEQFHELDHVHGDISSENIILSPGDHVSLIDFDYMKRIGTELQYFEGNPIYRAPELWNTDAYDKRTDLYAVGVVLYRLCAGREAFFCNDNDVCGQHFGPPVPELGEEVPESLKRVIMKMIERNPDKRYQNVEEARKDLEETLANQ